MITTVSSTFLVEQLHSTCTPRHSCIMRYLCSFSNVIYLLPLFSGDYISGTVMLVLVKLWLVLKLFIWYRFGEGFLRRWNRSEVTEWTWVVWTSSCWILGSGCFEVFISAYAWQLSFKNKWILNGIVNEYLCSLLSFQNGFQCSYFALIYASTQTDLQIDPCSLMSCSSDIW